MNEWSSHATSIVLVGTFNPAIFQPMWLAINGLIRKEEADAVIEKGKDENFVVLNNITQYSLEWAALRVQRERFQLITEKASEKEICDLTVGIFRLLEHTPITAVGLNQSAHFEIDAEEKWHTIGHRLAPKPGIWDDILQKPGLQTLTVKGTRPDGKEGCVLVRIEPSTKFKYGVYVDVNDHFQMTEPKAKEATRVVQEEWDASKTRATKIFDHFKGLIGS